MNAVLLTTCLLLLVAAFMVMYRAFSGPTVFDRILAVNALGTKTVVIVALLGFFGEPGFFPRHLLGLRAHQLRRDHRHLALHPVSEARLVAWNDVVSTVFLLTGVFFALTGALGILRMPDFYSRLHPAGKSDTLAQGLILVGLMFQAGDPMVAIKLALLAGLLFVTAPTATHAISRAAELDGLEPWTKADPAQGTREDGSEVADG